MSAPEAAAGKDVSAVRHLERGMKRCALLIPDAGPLNSLWVADRLDLLLRLDMPVAVVDAVYDEVTSDPRYPRDAEVKAFIEHRRPPFVIEETDIGAEEERG